MASNILWTLSIVILALAATWMQPNPVMRKPARFLNNQQVNSAPRALFLTAHPDDECMFFAPSIKALSAQGWEVSGLCMSYGELTERERVSRRDWRLQKPLTCIFLLFLIISQEMSTA
jgi:hypothetical protein